MKFLVIEVIPEDYGQRNSAPERGLSDGNTVDPKQHGFVLCESTYQWISVSMQKYMCRIMCTPVLYKTCIEVDSLSLHRHKVRNI